MINYQNIIKRWEHLPLREKRAVAIGSFIVILLLGYTLIGSPLANKIISLRQQIVKEKKSLAWMQSADIQIQLMEKHLNAAKTSSKSLLGLVQAEIKQSLFAKKITGLRQADKDSIQLNLNSVPFDEMIKWLIQIWEKQGLQVVRINLVSTEEIGIVTAEIELRI